MGVLTGNLLVNDVIRKRFSSLVVLGNLFKDVFIPDPVFKHLTWHFNEISLDGSARESAIVSFRAHVVHDMAEFMEESDNLAVLKQ